MRLSTDFLYDQIKLYLLMVFQLELLYIPVTSSTPEKMTDIGVKFDTSHNC